MAGGHGPRCFHSHSVLPIPVLPPLHLVQWHAATQQQVLVAFTPAPRSQLLCCPPCTLYSGTQPHSSRLSVRVLLPRSCAAPPSQLAQWHAAAQQRVLDFFKPKVPKQRGRKSGASAASPDQLPQQQQQQQQRPAEEEEGEKWQQQQQTIEGLGEVEGLQQQPMEMQQGQQQQQQLQEYQQAPHQEQALQGEQQHQHQGRQPMEVEHHHHHPQPLIGEGCLQQQQQQQQQDQEHPPAHGTAEQGDPAAAHPHLSPADTKDEEMAEAAPDAEAAPLPMLFQAPSQVWSTLWPFQQGAA